MEELFLNLVMCIKLLPIAQAEQYGLLGLSERYYFKMIPQQHL